MAAAVSRACPRWLLFVEGVSHKTRGGAPSVSSGQSDDGHMWASNLEGMRSRPLVMPDPTRLVLSPHVYGPSVAPQPYFEAADFPKNMGRIWETHFGFIHSSRIGCVVVGEWGGWNVDQDSVWHRAFSEWLVKRQIGSFCARAAPNCLPTAPRPITPDCAICELL